MNTINNNLLLAQQSLKGLNVGDCIGNAFIKKRIDNLLQLNDLEDFSLPYSDDTEQANILYNHICKNNDIIPDKLLNDFVEKFKKSKIKDEHGPKTKHYYNDIINNNLVYPLNSFGNGCLMRLVPTICYFYKDKNIINKCLNSVLYTHNNIESFESVVFLIKFVESLLDNLTEIRNYHRDHYSIIQNFVLPKSLEFISSECLKKDINKIINSELHIDIKNVVRLVGNGQLATCFDTLPFCIWVSIRNINNYENAIKECAESKGDIDTNCAIVGSIVSLFDDIPEKYSIKCKTYEY